MAAHPAGPARKEPSATHLPMPEYLPSPEYLPTRLRGVCTG